MEESHGNSIHWFRKGLRIHDNPGLVEAVRCGRFCWPVFILDPWFVKNMKIGPLRWRFLVQSLTDLDYSLKKLNSRLFILRGNPADVLPKIVKQWKIKLLTFESDTEPYAKLRDEEIENLMKNLGVKVTKFRTNMLYNPEQVIEFNGKPPLTYQAFLKTADKIGLPPKPDNTLKTLNEIFSKKDKSVAIGSDHDELYGVPTLEELGVNTLELNSCLHPGGESEALKRLEEVLKNESYICKFAKPDTSPNSLNPSTTVLSPYVKFGCLSVRTFYHKIRDVYSKSKIGFTKPPVSLHGQLFWREFFYTAGSATPNFDRMVGNPICLQIPWNENKQFLEAWANAKTGYPFIDAIMTQLRTEGWIHHLARHAVACFLTRGDLWISWEQGMKVFEELLLDADWSLNAGNWMWLSCSAFFHQYFRVYSPIAFGKKTDKNGDYIRKYIPALKRFPPEYIYEPWKAPRKLQEQLGCVIGKDYPAPIVDHEKARTENLSRMNTVYKTKKNESEKSKNESKSSENLSKRIYAEDVVKENVKKMRKSNPKSKKLLEDKMSSNCSIEKYLKK